MDQSLDTPLTVGLVIWPKGGIYEHKVPEVVTFEDLEAILYQEIYDSSSFTPHSHAPYGGEDLEGYVTEIHLHWDSAHGKKGPHLEPGTWVEEDCPAQNPNGLEIGMGD